MSLGADRPGHWPERFPRVSGDEPVREQPSKDGPKFSPRERG